MGFLDFLHSSEKNIHDFAFNITENPVHVHDFHATMMHLLGIEHTKLTYRFEGRDYRLTDVAGEVVRKILA